MDDTRANLIGFGVTAVIFFGVAAGVFWWWDSDRRAVEYNDVMSSSSVQNIQALARMGTPDAERQFRAIVQNLQWFLDRRARGTRANAVRVRLEATEFEWARARGTVESYTNYLQRYPQGEHASTAGSWLASARTWLTCLRGPVRPSADRAKRIGLDVREWYGKKTVECVGRGIGPCGRDSQWRDTSGSSRDPGAQPFVRARAEALLESAGYTVTEPPGSDVGETCVLNVTGIAEAAYYSPGGFRYTGGSITASVRLVAGQGTGTLRMGTFQLSERPLGTLFSGTSEASPTPSNEPAGSSETLHHLFVTNGRFDAALAAALADVLGDEFLLDVVLCPSISNREPLRAELARRVDARCGPGSDAWIAAFASGGKAAVEIGGRGAVPGRQQ